MPQNNTGWGGLRLAAFSQQYLSAGVKTCSTIKISWLPKTHLHKQIMQKSMHRRYPLHAFKNSFSKRRILRNLKTALDCVQKLKPRKNLQI